MGRSLDNVLEARALDERSQALLKNGNFAEAIPLCQRVVQLTPNIASRWARLGRAFSLAKRHEEALAAYGSAIALDSSAAGAWLNKSWELIHLKRYDEALTAAEQACALLADGQQQAKRGAHTVRALALLQLGRHEEALSALDTILSVAPDDGDAWLQRGHICVRLQRFQEAEEALLRGIALKPASIAGLKELIELYLLHVRDYIKADEFCERLIALHAQDGLAWRYKASILYALQKYPEAVGACEQAIACGGLAVGSPSWLWNRYACALSLVGRYGDALRALDENEKVTTDVVAVQVNRGEIFSRIERYTEALTYYIAFAELTDVSLLTNMVEAFVHLDYVSEAEEVEQTLIAEQPGSKLAWYVTGMLESQRERFDEAQMALRKVLEVDPEYAPALKELARLLLKFDDAEHACQTIERALTLDSYDARAWTVKGQALRAAGREEEAVVAERRGAELLAEQTAQVDAYLREKGQPDAPHE